MTRSKGTILCLKPFGVLWLGSIMRACQVRFNVLPAGQNHGVSTAYVGIRDAPQSPNAYIGT